MVGLERRTRSYSSGGAEVVVSWVQWGLSSIGSVERRVMGRIDLSDDEVAGVEWVW